MSALRTAWVSVRAWPLVYESEAPSESEWSEHWAAGRPFCPPGRTLRGQPLTVGRQGSWAVCRPGSMPRVRRGQSADSLRLPGSSRSWEHHLPSDFQWPVWLQAWLSRLTLGCLCLDPSLSQSPHLFRYLSHCTSSTAHSDSLLAQCLCSGGRRTGAKGRLWCHFRGDPRLLSARV